MVAGRENSASSVTSKTVLDAHIAQGVLIKQLGEPVFINRYAVAFDKSSTLDPESLSQAVDELITTIHADGRLTERSMKWFRMELKSLIN